MDPAACLELFLRIYFYGSIPPFLPATRDKLGILPESLQSENPKIIVNPYSRRL